jgi:hypothetical protein
MPISTKVVSANSARTRCGFRGEDSNVKSQQTTDNGRYLMNAKKWAVLLILKEYTSLQRIRRTAHFFAFIR